MDCPKLDVFLTCFTVVHNAIPLHEELKTMYSDPKQVNGRKPTTQLIQRYELKGIPVETRVFQHSPLCSTCDFVK